MTHRKPRTTCPHTGDVMYDCRCGQCDTPLDATPATGTVEEKDEHIRAIRTLIMDYENWFTSLPGQKVGTPTLWRDVSWHLRQMGINTSPAPPASTTETPK